MKSRISTVLAFVLTAAPVSAQIVSFEGNSFPETEGWTRLDRLFPPERWLADGSLHFNSEVVFPERCEGEDEFYRWELEDWAGVPRFFLEGRLITDGPNSELIAIAPASLVASGQRGMRFHTTISRDEVHFIWDGPSIFVPVRPNKNHTYRVDVYGSFWFEWSIDGVVYDYGSYGRQYPTADSFIIWGARAACFDNVTAFDYVRFGVPEEPQIDCDSVRKLKARCREGRGGEGKIVAKVRTWLEEGTDLTLTNNGDHRPLVIDARGRAKAKYKNQSGEHTLLLLNCPAISQEIVCGP